MSRQKRGPSAGQAEGEDLEGAQGGGDDAVADLVGGEGVLEEVAAAGGGDAAVGGDGDPGAVAARLVEAHDEVAGAVVGDLHGVDLDAPAGDDDGARRDVRGGAVGDHA